uniref:Pentatricopeptide repeat-containing protein n=1 Tax=Arundo donax TaxID=35708 RepID=A0A0A9BFJ9_ARUDO
MMTNLINEGLLVEADNIFSSMEKTCCAPNALLNHVVRVLLEKGEIIRSGSYLSKIDENNFSLEASTIELLISLFSRKGHARNT